MAATGAGHFTARHVHDAFLGVIHHHHPFHHPLTDHRTGDQRAIGVEAFNPVVVLDPGLDRVDFGQPDDRATAAQGEHDQVVGIGAVDTPLLVRRDPVQHDLAIAIGLLAQHVTGGAGVDRRPITHQLLTEGLHPGVILEELLTAGDGAPGYVLVHVGVAGAIAHMIIFQAGPGRAGNDLARLRLNIPEADRLVLFAHRQMAVVTTGELRQRFPGLDRHVAVGFRGQRENHFAGIDCAIDLRAALADTLIQHFVIKLPKELDFVISIPADALAAVTQFLQQGSEGAELLEGVGEIAFDHDHVRAVLARHWCFASGLPVGAAKRLSQFAGAVM